jgi:hypothetical protein
MPSARLNLATCTSGGAAQASEANDVPSAPPTSDHGISRDGLLFHRVSCSGLCLSQVGTLLGSGNAHDLL